MRYLNRPSANPMPAAQPYRRRSAYRRLVAAIRSGALAGALVLAIAAPLWLWRAGTIEQAVASWADGAIRWSADQGLVIEDVYITGRLETASNDIVTVLALNASDAILGVDPEGARSALEALPWVRQAAVSRELPHTLRIELVEREPIAIWQHEGAFRLVDAEGVVIDAAPPAHHRGLPLVVGPDAPDHARALFAMLATEPTLAGRVTASIRVGGRRWNLELDSGQVVQLPERDPEAAWTRLAELSRERALIDRADILAVDLRLFPDQTIVRRAPVAPSVPVPQPKGKET